MYAIPCPTWRTTAFLLPDDDGRQSDWPIVILNPALERVVIERVPPDRWRVVPDGYARGAGLVTGPRLTIRRDRPLPGSGALVAPDGTIAIELGGRTYEAPPVQGFGTAARHAGGVLLIVSHATWPSGIVLDHFASCSDPAPQPPGGSRSTNHRQAPNNASAPSPAPAESSPRSVRS